jgi:hypothetical protein
MIGTILQKLKPVGSILLFFFWPSLLTAQDIVPPSVQCDFKQVTSYEDLSSYVRLLDEQSDLLTVEIIGQSVEGRNLYALKFSSSKFGEEKSKIKVLIFAQQHGNEQSGKEGALLLAGDLLKKENRYLFDKIDLVIVPQVNPDGSEKNQRRNAHDADLNRNHLILTEPETQALHRLFDKYLFEVTMDVHEYSPYSDEWKEYGYRKNSDETIGTTTNVNVSQNIRSLQESNYVPFFFKYLDDYGYSSFEYTPGGPPGVSYFRHSTFDINDGRQSLGIQNTFSLIQEGMNGEDDYVENLKHRSQGQFLGMRGLLEYTFVNNEVLKKLVESERQKLISGDDLTAVSIQSDHVQDGTTLNLPLYSYSTGQDTIVMAEDYRPVVKSLFDVRKPEGYLIPKNIPELAGWAERQQLSVVPFKISDEYRIEGYRITEIDSIDFEGDMTVDPGVTIEDAGKISLDDYLFIPTKQLKGNLLILALEPRSTLGLVTYKDYAHLLKKGEAYPVLRVERIKK